MIFFSSVLVYNLKIGDEVTVGNPTIPNTAKEKKNKQQTPHNSCSKQFEVFVLFTPVHYVVQEL